MSESTLQGSGDGNHRTIRPKTRHRLKIFQRSCNPIFVFVIALSISRSVGGFHKPYDVTAAARLGKPRELLGTWCIHEWSYPPVSFAYLTTSGDDQLIIRSLGGNRYFGPAGGRGSESVEGVGVDWERGQFVCIVTLTPPGLERYQDHHLASTGMRQWAVALWLKSSEQPKIQKELAYFAILPFSD